MKGIQGTSNKTYRQIMGNGLRYEIPKFQRDYTWEVDNWDDLWQDIKMLLSGEETEHYMGYLVLQTSDNKNYYIIDGQQRLTTLSIIILSVLKSLNDLAEKNVDSENNLKRKDNLQNSYIGFINPVTLISDNKLKLNRNSDEYYRFNMVLLKNLPIRNTNASEKHLRECFNWFYEKIKKDFLTGEQLAGFIDSIVDKLFFTEIQVSDEINAFKVFETLNARGVQLSSSDLLKNHLFSVVDNKKTSSVEIDELELLWSKIVSKLGNQKFEDFLRYYWNSFNKTVRKNNLFKIIKKSIDSKDKVFKLLRELNDTADIYLAIQEPEDELWKSQPKIKKSLSHLKLFGIKQTNSILIAAYKNLKIEEFIQLLNYCDVISFRYNIIGGLNPNETEEIYNDIALNIVKNKKFELAELNSVYVTDDKFVNDFSTKNFRNTSRNHKIVKYILSEIEWQKFNNEISYESDLYTVEHILPESADSQWGEFSDESVERTVCRLGNLTLLEKNLNKDAGILPFSEKIKIYNKSQSQLTSTLSKEYETWNESKVSERQKQFAKMAKGIWRIAGL